MKRFLVISLLLLTGCSNALITSGTSLDAIGKEFGVVGRAYYEGCGGGTDNPMPQVISDTKCEEFRRFGLKFQEAYPLALKLWHIAKEAADTAAAGSAAAIITQLASQLSSFAAEVFINLSVDTSQGAK